MTILRAQNITKKFSHPEKITILDKINLSINEGEIIAITGPSGSGKTTLLHILGALDTPSEGEVFIDNRLVKSDQADYLRLNYIGFIFQSFYLLEDLSALDNVLLPARIARKEVGKTSITYEKALHLLKEVDLLHRKDHMAKLLSGGEAQRIAIARALMNDPKIIFADEPSGSLDFAHAKEVEDLLLKLVKDSHKTLILITHNENLAKRSDKIYRLNDAKLH